MVVVLYGNPLDGLRIVGPFDSPADALAYTEHPADGERDWWIAEVDAPADPEAEALARVAAAGPLVPPPDDWGLSP